MKKAIHEAWKPINLIPPASRATDGTTHNGQAAGNVGHDLTQYKARELGILVITGAMVDTGTLAITLKHGDVVATTDSSYVNLVDGAGNVATVSIVGTQDNALFLARVRADVCKKYLNVVAVQGGSNVAMIYGVVLLVGDALVEAISQTAGVVFFAHKP